MLLTTDDTYDPDRLTYDRELLRRFYLKHGFADFRVTSAVAELTPDGQGFFITVTLNEGERYKIGSADVKVALKGVNPDDLRPLVKCEPGDWYNGEEVEAATQKLTDAVGSKGYAFVDVRPQVKRNPDTRTVDVVYEVGEGPRVYVDRIDITGNVRTLDKVIRREFTLVEGDAFNTAKLRRSQQRIKDLNFFEKVDVSNVPSENAPDRTVIKVDVTEKSTGELSFGVGWSTVAGPLIETSLRERNLLGRGQDLGAKVSLGTMQNNFDLSFTEPYFLDRRLTAGADAFAIERHIQATAGYDSNTVGFDLRTGYHISEDLTQGWKYVLREDEIKNVNSGASMYIQEQSGLATTSLLEHSLMYDRRDSKVDPTEGYFLRMVNDIAGLGGSQDFVRNSFDVGNYYSVADQTVLSLTGTVGVIEGFAGKTVRITDRYYLGGDTMRGFQTYGVSPRDAGTGDPLGGSWEYRGTAQLQFPLGLPQEFGVGGRLFTDVGAVGDTPDSQSTAVDQSAMPRVTVGTGLSWKSPMGPVAVDIGMPLVKQSYDKTQIFHFSFGTKF